jgi:DNA-binding transcriptional MerR regulator
MQDIMADSEVRTIKEVSLIVDEEQHVLRYWEREFAFLNPQKNDAGNRMYTSVDLAIVKELKRLIRTERKTIQEARRAFLEKYPDGTVDIQTVSKDDSHDISDLSQIKSELEEIIKKLKT